MAINKHRRRQRRGWLVRIDRELFRDVKFGRRSDLRAKYAYTDSLFYLAAGDGPHGLYPFGELASEFPGEAEEVARQLTAIGMWEDCGVGFRVPFYRCAYIVADGRQPLPRPLRAAVLARDGHRCVKCGATESLAIDHIYPWSLGGEDSLDNLQVLCRPCNSKKGAKV